ncbi:Jupiter microtubule associated-1 [Galemys pyrenaicus]|uniref:Jupiter microtubule associated-1 n=1 Tax=Galemys pyrenaicus TaxID=202257 RepID=A0A8J5ZTM5_GALPY|nr:Jupiter microtubule associated-1 [Galemys pyrenaicus]
MREILGHDLKWVFCFMPRVLRPPGGGSNFSLGFDEPTEQPARRNKMASSIFGTPEENPPSWAKSAGAKASGGREDPEPSGAQRRNSSEANSGDSLDLKVSVAIPGGTGCEVSLVLSLCTVLGASLCRRGLLWPSLRKGGRIGMETD